MEIVKKQIAYNITARYTKPVYIAIHDTANTDTGADAMRHFAFFNGGNRSSSADVFVDDKQIVQVNDFNKYYTWHVGDGHGKYGISNANSIGIEMCINRDGDYEKAFENLIAATRYYMTLLGIDAAHVVRHYDASRKNCPQSFNVNGWARWYEFKRRLTETEDLTVTQYEALKHDISTLMSKNEDFEQKIDSLESKVGRKNETYNYNDNNMPAWVRGDVQWMQDRGILQGDDKGRLNLSPIKLWTVAVIVRTAKYLAKLMGVKM